MAITIDEQPTMGMARTPVLYLVSDTNYAEDSFVYTANVYIWQGLIGGKPATQQYQLKLPPNTTDGEAIFDVRTLLTDYFLLPQFDYTGFDDTQDMYVWVQIDFGYYYVDGGGVVREDEVDATTNAINAYNGYNIYSDSVNYMPTQHLGVMAISTYTARVLAAAGTLESLDCIPNALLGLTGGGYFMTDRPLVMDIPRGSTMDMFCLNDSAGIVTNIITDADNGTYVLNNDLTSGVNELARIQCGSADIDDIGKGTFDTYTIYGADTLGNQITQAYIFNVVEPCKYGYKGLTFINRYGVWDTIFTYGTQRNSIKVESSEIMHSPLSIDSSAFDFIQEYGQYHISNVYGRETIKLNTGWISEDWNEVVKQLLLTKSLYDADNLIPFTLETKSLNLKTSVNDGLFDYSFTLVYAHTAINTVS